MLLPPQPIHCRRAREQLRVGDETEGAQGEHEEPVGKIDSRALCELSVVVVMTVAVLPTESSDPKMPIEHAEKDVWRVLEHVLVRTLADRAAPSNDSSPLGGGIVVVLRVVDDVEPEADDLRLLPRDGGDVQRRRPSQVEGKEELTHDGRNCKRVYDPDQERVDVWRREVLFDHLVRIAAEEGKRGRVAVQDGRVRITPVITVAVVATVLGSPPDRTSLVGEAA
mmetsp:Transcript_40444/g.86265  ORF Transcript_40444/g.86265 Transcript_40444/m.86265 type:complete len:224 (-) Transcript_40444:491-1162(-)